MNKKRALIDMKLCQNCKVCPAEEDCSTGAITREGEGEPLFVDIQCTGCAKCVRRCPHNAISLL